MVLQALVPDRLWTHRAQVDGLPIRTCMTCVRLDDGSLWVHSPTPATTEVTAAVRALGTVNYVVAPNRFHHLYFADWLTAFPEARGLIARGLAEKLPELASATPVTSAPDLPELQRFDIDGIPALQESVWFHHPTGTLLTCDLLFHFGRDNPFWVQLFARASGVFGQLRMSRTMRWLMVKDHAALRTSVQPLLRLPVERITVTHDTFVDQNGSAELEAAFAWLAR